VVNALRSHTGYTVKDIKLQFEPLQDKGVRWAKEKMGITNTTEFSGSQSSRIIFSTFILSLSLFTLILQI